MSYRARKHKKALSMAVKLAMLAPKKSETDKAILALLAEAEQLEAELDAAEAENERLKSEAFCAEQTRIALNEFIEFLVATRDAADTEETT